MAEELIHVTVEILDRKYPLRIQPSREAALRKAAALINRQARNYGDSFAYKDRQDLLAMVSLGQITELIKTQDNLRYKDQQLVEKLKELDSTLETYLHPAQNSL